MRGTYYPTRRVWEDSEHYWQCYLDTAHLLGLITSRELRYELRLIVLVKSTDEIRTNRGMRNILFRATPGDLAEDV